MSTRGTAPRPAALLLAAALAAGVAQAAPTTYVSNLGQGDGDESYRGESLGWFAQTFTTGSTSAGYALGSVAVSSVDVSSDGFTLEVCSVDANQLPTSTCRPFTVRSEFIEGTVTFEPDSAVTLAASTTYAVVLKPTGDRVTFEVALGNPRQDSGASSGWSISNLFYWYNAAESRWDGSADDGGTLNQDPILIAIRGPGTANATGAPAVRGGATVGATLLADPSGIADADGLDDAAFAYRWLRVDGTTETAIEGATERVYRLGADDRGKQVKVEASFVDDDDNVETRTAAAFPADGTVQAPAAGIPLGHARCTWDPLEAELSVAERSGPRGFHGFAAASASALYLRAFGSLSPKTFPVHQYERTIDALVLDSRRGQSTLEFRTTETLEGRRQHNTLHVGDTALALPDAAYDASRRSYVWADTGLSWSAGDKVAVRIARLRDLGDPEALTGAPAVSLEESRSHVDGSRVRLSFDYPLAVHCHASPSLFTVTEDGTDVAVRSARNKYDTVWLGLANDVAAGAEVEVEYTLPDQWSPNGVLTDKGTNPGAFSKTFDNRTPAGNVWTAEMTFGDLGSNRRGFSAGGSVRAGGGLSRTSFRLGSESADHVVEALYLRDRLVPWTRQYTGKPTLDLDRGGLPAGWVLQVGECCGPHVEFPFADATYDAADHVWTWGDRTLPLYSDEPVWVRLRGPGGGGSGGGSGNVDRGLTPQAEPVAAMFRGVPASHDGATAFTVRIRMSAALHKSTAAVAANLTVANGTLGAVRRNNAYTAWHATVTPSGDDDVTVRLAASPPCDRPGAMCTRDGRRAGAAKTTVPGPEADPETPPPAFSVADARAAEDDGTLSFAVVLDPAPGAAATVDYATADGTATAGRDYAAASGTLAFAAQETSKTVAVTLLDDGAAEADETFTLTLSNASGADIADATATGTIADDGDEPRPMLSVSAARAAEGGTASFAVTLDRAADATVTAYYTTIAATATAGSDFTPAWGTAEFPAGTTSRTVAVSLLDDDEKEFDETFTLELAWATGAGYADPTGVGTIVDDDAPRAELHTVPAEHGGKDQTFAAGLAFSEEIDGIGFGWVRDTLATATNAEVRRARRVVPQENREWTLRVRPTSAADVVLALTPGLRLPDGTPLGVGAAATVRGPTPNGAFVQGTLLTLAWPAARDAFGTPSGSDWTVTVNGVPRAVATAEIAGRRAVLLLSEPVAAGDAVTVGYTGSAMHPLADASGRIRSAPWDGVAADNATGAQPPADGSRPAGAPAHPRLATAPPDARRLDASGLGLADLAPLRGFAALERVDLSDNALADLRGIEAHGALRELDLSGNRIADLGPLRALLALERLDLAANRVADLSPLAGLPALRVLVLDGNAVSDLGPLTHLSALEHLGLAGNRVPDVTPLQDLPRLRRLDLGGNPVSDLSPLGDVGSLEWIALPGQSAAAADALARLTGLRWMWPGTADRPTH